MMDLRIGQNESDYVLLDMPGAASVVAPDELEVDLYWSHPIQLTQGSPDYARQENIPLRMPVVYDPQIPVKRANGAGRYLLDVHSRSDTPPGNYVIQLGSVEVSVQVDDYLFPDVPSLGSNLSACSADNFNAFAPYIGIYNKQDSRYKPAIARFLEMFWRFGIGVYDPFFAEIPDFGNTTNGWFDYANGRFTVSEQYERLFEMAFRRQKMHGAMHLTQWHLTHHKNSFRLGGERYDKESFWPVAESLFPQMAAWLDARGWLADSWFMADEPAWIRNADDRRRMERLWQIMTDAGLTTAFITNSTIHPGQDAPNPKFETDVTCANSMVWLNERNVESDKKRFNRELAALWSRKAQYNILAPPYQIDRLQHVREAIGWTSFLEGFEFFLHWECLAWGEKDPSKPKYGLSGDAWNDCSTKHGNHALAMAWPTVGAPEIPGVPIDLDTVIPSFKLFGFRSAVRDYELLKMVKGRYDEYTAMEVARQVADNSRDYEPEAIGPARLLLRNMLTSDTPPPPPPPLDPIETRMTEVENGLAALQRRVTALERTGLDMDRIRRELADVLLPEPGGSS